MKKLCVLILSLLLAMAAVGAGMTAIAAEEEGAAPAGKSTVLYSQTLTIGNWWFNGNQVHPEDFDTPSTSEDGKYYISKDYTYILFDINVPDDIRLVFFIKSGNDWLEFKCKEGALYYTRPATGGNFTEQKVASGNEIVLNGFSGTVAIPISTMVTTTDPNYDLYSLELCYITFHDAYGDAGETNEGHWNSTVTNIMLADADYVFTPVSVPAGKSYSLYSQTLSIANWWYDGNAIYPDSFDTPVAAGETYTIPKEYTYFLFDINVPDDIRLVLNIKTGNNWLDFQPKEGTLYYTKPASGGNFTEQTVATGNEIVLEAFSGTVAIPLDSFKTSNADGYDVYSLEIHHITFHDAYGTGEQNDGHWNSTVTNILLADADYVFKPAEGEVSFVLLNQTVAQVENIAQGVAVSADGTDIDKGSYWVTQEIMTAFTEALAEAKALPDKADVTQEEVDNAREALQAAADAFNAAKAEGSHISENYGLVKSNYTIAVSANEINSFEGGAINNLTEFDKLKFYLDASAQTQDVNLNIFLTINAGWEQGMNLGYSAGADIQGYDPTSPGASYTRADRFYLLQADGETLAQRYSIDVVTEQGTQTETGYITVPAGFKGTVYVPFTAFKPTYTGYLVNVSGSLVKFNINAKDEVGSLPASDVRFTSETVDEALNTNYLSEAIAAAKALSEQVKISENGEDVATTELWVSQAAKDALDAAITAAEAVLAEAEGVDDQETVDAATETLNAAIAAFEEEAQAGTKDFYTVLEGKIAEAEAALNSVEISTTATEVEKGNKWVTVEVATAFNNAIAAAKEVRKDASQADFEAAISALESAKATFDAAISEGTKGDATTDPGTDAKGCSSAVAGVSVAASAVILCAAVLFLTKKRHA